MKQTFMQYLMVGLMIVGAYFIGVYKTENTYLKQGVNGVGGTLGNNGQETVPTNLPEEKTVLSDDEWKKALETSVSGVGEKKAPVTIVEWTDYQCPFCKRYIDETFSKIKENYIDKGKVRYEVRDLILPFHPNAKPAAIAARCAAKEGKFWEMHDKLFEEQTVWSEMTDVKAKFSEYATSFGISTSTWDSCVADSSVASAVESDTQIASSLSASGTPTFMVNGTLVVGAQPYEVFEQAIEQALK